MLFHSVFYIPPKIPYFKQNGTVILMFVKFTEIIKNPVILVIYL